MAPRTKLVGSATRATDSKTDKGKVRTADAAIDGT